MSEYKVPYTFIAGTRAKASQVNADFDYVTDGLKALDESKANITGDANYNFDVAEPTQLQHAVTKRYVDLAISQSGGSGGSGVGKSMFEVFHTLSTKTPSGAFSLRTGEVILDAQNTYPAFWVALQEQGTSLIPDFTDVTFEDPTDGYQMSFTNIASSDKTHEPRVFSPYSWFTADNAPSNNEPIIAQIDLKESITCPYFRLNSHVVDTYNSTGEANPAKAVKVASISVRLEDDTWTPVVIINEKEAPTSNERYFKSSQPDLKFNAVRIVIAENFGANQTDVSLYPFDPSLTSVRVVPEKQWQWEVETFHETGAFVLDEAEGTIRLPKITRMLSGVSELWQVGIPESNEVSKSSVRWQEGTSQTTEGSSDATISLDTVSTGLWIQVYNAVAEDALSNIRYIPHAVLFEERPFRFVPDKETGWAVSDGNWKDGEYYTSAMSELLNEYASAVTPAGKQYKLSPKGMRFVDDATYISTYSTYKEVPYYVIDSENFRFKTPMSDNYVRCTHTIDNAGDFLLDSAPDIVGQFGVDDQVQNSGTGAFYNTGTAFTYDASSNSTAGGKYLGFAASRSNEVYGRDKEVRPKSTYQLMCVFLGNEIPQSSSVDALYKIKAQDERITALEKSQSTSAEGLKEDIDKLKTITEAQSVKINENTNSIKAVDSKAESAQNLIVNIQSDIGALQDKDELTDASIESLTNRVVQVETTQTEQGTRLDAVELESSTTAGSLETINSTIDDIQAELLKKAETTYVDGELAKKQIKLKPSSDFNLDDEGNLSLKISPVDAYTKKESDDKFALKTDVDNIKSALGNIKFVSISQSDYDALEVKDANTLYIVTGE